MQQQNLFRLGRGIALGIALAGAAGGCEGKIGPWLGESGTTQGHIKDWNQKSGYQIVMADGSGDYEGAPMPIDRDGNFRVELPAKATVTTKWDFLANPPIAAGSCPEQPALSKQGVGYGFASLSALDATGVKHSIEVGIVGQPMPYSIVSYIYSEGDVELTGRLICMHDGESPTTYQMDIHVKRGWNVQLSESFKENPLLTKISTPALSLDMLEFTMN